MLVAFVTHFADYLYRVLDFSPTRCFAINLACILNMPDEVIINQSSLVSVICVLNPFA